MSIAFSICLIGLDGSGKTSLVYSFKESVSEKTEYFSTAGFQIHMLNVPNISKSILVYDCSGQGRHRDNWKMFYSEVDAVVMVIDASEQERLSVVKDLIEELIADEVILKRNLPIAFLFNKNDKMNIMTKDNLKDYLKLDFIKTKSNIKKVLIKETSGFSGLGITDVLDWISLNLSVRRLK